MAVNLTSLSKFLSLILRHKPEVVDIKLDSHGWADVDTLIKNINEKSNHHIDLDMLCLIVETDDKSRYSFNDDMTKIRANQGHSIKVDVELEEKQPPSVLYHGTSTWNKTAIEHAGEIKPMSRLYVHLSIDEDTALSVGKRHGEPCVIRIDCDSMVKDGYKFFKSKNGVWLTEHVPCKYFI